MPEGRHNSGFPGNYGPHLPGEPKKQQKQEEFRCIHKDCIFRAAGASPNACNYLLITGHSRIKGLSEEERDPALCKKYRRGKRKKIDAKAHLETPYI